MIAHHDRAKAQNEHRRQAGSHRHSRAACAAVTPPTPGSREIHCP